MNTKQEPPVWTPRFAGDQCLVLEFGQHIDKQLVNQVVELNARVSAAMLTDQMPGLLETVPTFRSLALIYDPLTTQPDQLISQIRALEQVQTDNTSHVGKHFSIPVHYGRDAGPDLQSVADLTGLDPQQVISLHQQTSFTVYMLGFLPGFAFLGDTPAELHLPRRTEPRVRVPAGSVAIAMQLTGIYPWDSPGGWHILGNCPIPLFNGRLEPPALFKAGDTIRFRAIDESEYNALAAASAQGTFKRDSLESSAHESP